MMPLKTLILLLLLVTALAACDDDAVRVAPLDNPPTTSCNELEDYMHTNALVSAGGRAFGVDGNGDIVVIANEDGGLVIADVGLPTSQQVRGVVDTAGIALDVDLAGTIAVVAYGPTGLVIVDVANPDAPRILSALPTPGDAIGVAVNGNFAYVADDQVGLVVVDVGDPGAPVYRGVENTPGEVSGVAVSGNLALVSDEQLGLRVVNVAAPNAPWLVTSVATPGVALDVAVDGSYAFVADAQSGVHVIDISKPGSAGIVATVSVSARATAVAAHAGRVFVADGPNGVTVYDAMDPLNLSRIAASSSNSVGFGVRATSDRLYVAESTGGARVVELQGAETPPLESIVITLNTNEAVAVAADSALVYVATADGQVGNGIFTVVETDDGGGRVIGQTTFGGTPTRGVSVSDGFAFVATTNNAVVVIDVRKPMTPTFVRTIGVLNGVNDVAVVDSVVFVAHSPGGVAVMPLGGSQLPGGVSMVGGAVSVAVDQLFAYATTLDGRLYSISLNTLQVFDIAIVGERAAGVTLQRIPDPVFPEFLYDLLVYVCVRTSNGSGVRVLDAENPGFPIPIQMVRTAGAALDVVVDLNMMYVATGDDDVEVFDISDLNNPRPVGTIVPPDGFAYGVALTLDTFAAAGGPSGLLLAPRTRCP